MASVSRDSGSPKRSLSNWSCCWESRKSSQEKERLRRQSKVCALHYKLAVPIRRLDLIDEFGRSSCGLSNIFLHVMEFLDCKYDRLLQFNQEYAAQHLADYANEISDAGGHITNVWSFIDGTVRGVCRPQPRNRSQDGAYLSQQPMYNGHKRKHAVKYQSLTAPDGLIVHLFGPYPGRNHDIKMYHASRLAAAVRADPRFKAFRIYGDLAYRQGEVTCCPFGDAVGSMSVENKTVNKSMSKVRVSVEWSYGQICSYWSALDFKRQARTGTTPVAQMYRMGVLFTNCITCSRGGNSISDYFNLQPPSLTTYLDSEARL